MRNARFFCEAVKGAAEEQGIVTTFYSDDWICLLEKGGERRLLYGYNFPLNPASSVDIARDKAATSSILGGAGIPSVNHRLFIGPGTPHGREEGNFSAIFRMLNSGQIVCKPNEGTGGNMVFRVSSAREAEAALTRIWRSSRAAAVCEYLEIGDEFRCFFLGGKVPIVYRKRRPFIIGNGQDSVLSRACAEFGDSAALELLAASEEGNRWSHIPAHGERYDITWKHNLGKGAVAELLYGEASAPLVSLAMRAAGALGLSVCSVDIVLVDGNLIVMEINSGIMMEKLAASGDEARALALDFFRAALTSIFE